jgi:hypothetical protein
MCLAMQASLLCVLEEKLFAPSHDDLAGEVMYPSWLVLATSAAGLAAAHWLRTAGRVSHTAAWVLVSLYAAKLCMLVLPEADLVLPASLLALAASSPMFLYEPEHRPLPHGAFVPPPPQASRRHRTRLAPWQGLAHGVCTLAAVLLARFAVFDVVQYLSSSRPTEGTLLGSLLLVAAGSLAPLVLRCYGANAVLPRVLAMTAMTGALLLFLQPPLPMKGGARCPHLPLAFCPRLWDERHIPMHGTEDVEVWGRGLARQEHWPRWLLLAACMVGASAAALRSLALLSVIARVATGAGAGVLVGLYLALEVVPEQASLQLLLVAACLVTTTFAALLQLPAARVPGLLPTVFTSWLVLLGLTMLLQTELPTPAAQPQMKRLFPDSSIEVARELWMATRASLLGVFAAHALLMAFALKLKATASLHAADGGLSEEGGHDARLYGQGTAARYGQQPADLFCGMIPSGAYARFAGLLQLRGGAHAGGVALQRLSRDGLAWAPAVGNVCTLIAFAMAVSLNVYVSGGAPEAIFMLTPLLLLLSQDTLLLTGLQDKQRYFPPLLATTTYLALAALGALLSSPTGVGSQAAFLAAAVAASLPSHVVFLSWMWTQRPRPTGGLVLALLLNVASLVVNAALAVWTVTPVPLYLNGMGFAFGLIQWFAMRHVHSVGAKLI